MAPAMPCKTCKKNKHGKTRSKTNDFRSKFPCILNASESTRMRKEESLPKYHEDHIAGRGDNSLQHYNMVHRFNPMPQAIKMQQEQQWIKNGRNLKRFRRGTWQKSETNQRWSMKQGRRAEKFISPHWWTSVIWRMSNWRQSTKNTKGRVVLRGDIVKDDSGSDAVFTEQGSSASQMTAAKVMDMILTLPPGGKVFAPGCASKAGRVSRWGARRT